MVGVLGLRQHSDGNRPGDAVPASAMCDFIHLYERQERLTVPSAVIQLVRGAG